MDNSVAHAPNLRARVREGLSWLTRHQFEDGSWSARYFRQMCRNGYCAGPGEEQHTVGITSLAALAILHSRQYKEPRFQKSLHRALAWLEQQQDPEGCFGSHHGKFLYGHALATRVFARAYQEFGNPLYPRIIRAGVRFLEIAQNPGQAWRYTVRSGDNDTSITVWAGAALLESRAAGIHISESSLRGIRRWMREVTNEHDGSVSYRGRRRGPAFTPGINDHFLFTESLTAAALTLRLQMGETGNAPQLQEGLDRLRRDLPTWNDSCADFSYWYHGLNALSRSRVMAPRAWKWWSGRLQKILPQNQRRYRNPNDQCAWGSWDPMDKWGHTGGRVYATSINILTLSLLLPETLAAKDWSD